MRHGIKLQSGFSTGERVLITSRRLCLSKMPGVVTGDMDIDGRNYVRVRVTAPWSTNVMFSVWARAEELREKRR